MHRITCNANSVVANEDITLLAQNTDTMLTVYSSLVTTTSQIKLRRHMFITDQSYFINEFF